MCSQSTLAHSVRWTCVLVFWHVHHVLRQLVWHEFYHSTVAYILTELISQTYTRKPCHFIRSSILTLHVLFSSGMYCNISNIVKLSAADVCSDGEKCNLRTAEEGHLRTSIRGIPAISCDMYLIIFMFSYIWSIICRLHQAYILKNWLTCIPFYFVWHIQIAPYSHSPTGSWWDIDSKVGRDTNFSAQCEA